MKLNENIRIEIIFICVMFVWVSSVRSAVTITKEGINGVTIALSPRLNQSHCQLYVDLIKGSIDEASTILEESLEGLRFRSLTVVTPESWTTCGNYNIELAGGPLTWTTADVRVGEAHPVFGNEPWTEQPRGCGLPGNFIYISAPWLRDQWSDRGSRIVQEWAKYRWGVFEEYGHLEDQIYPMSFPKSDTEWSPNVCTDEPLNVNYQPKCDKTTDCSYILKGSNLQISTSLMAVSQVENVRSFCDKKRHNSLIPTKQNAFCQGKSAEEVIMQHIDYIKWKPYTMNDAGPLPERPLTLKVMKENKLPSMVIAYETTESMRQACTPCDKRFGNQYEFEIEAIAQFINYEAPTSATIGLVSFNQIAEVQFQMISLDKNSRLDLSKKVLKSATRGTVVNIRDAIARSSKVLGSGNGIILLITRGTRDNDPVFTADELALAAEGHSVWIILYPRSSKKYLPVFDSLASITGGQLLTVNQILDDDFKGNKIMSPIVRMRLSETLRQTLHLDPSHDLQQINSGSCSEDPCEISFFVSDNYQGTSFLYLYTGKSDEIDTVEISLPRCGPEGSYRSWPSVQTTFIQKCDLLPTTKIVNVSIKRKVAYGRVVTEFVGHPKFNDSNFQFRIYASSHMFDLRYSSDSAPIIYAELMYQKRAIYFADIHMSFTINDDLNVIKFNDEGIGADVTGNDGIYSAYLVPIIPVGNFTFNISASNSYGTSKLMAEHFGKDSTSTVCCGSSLHLSENLDSPPTFLNLTREFVKGQISEVPNDLNLPPGQILDLTASQNEDQVNVQFTAPGSDLDCGTVTNYLVTFHNDSGYNAKIPLKRAPQNPGNLESFEIESVQCGSHNTFSIAAVDERGKKGSDSNIVTIFVTCSSKKLNTGSIVGIIIGVFLLFLIAFFIIYFLLKRKRTNKMNRQVTSRHQATSPRINSVPEVEKITSIRDLHLISEDNLSIIDDEITTGTLRVTEQPLFMSDNLSPNTVTRSNPDLLERESFIVYPQRPFDSNEYREGSLTSSHSIDSNQQKTEFQIMEPINQVGIPIPDQSFTSYRTYRSMDDLLQNNRPKKQPPKVPPKPFLRNIQV